MSTITLSQLGYMSPSEINIKAAEICALAEVGLHLYPCWGIGPQGCLCGKDHKEPKEWGKHPANTASTTLATNQKSIIDCWWTQHPFDNVGANPKLSECVVFDIDPRSDGHISWNRLLADLKLELPETVTTVTGEYQLSDGSMMRGFHVWFSVSPDVTFPSNLNSLGYTGIDIKHNGGVLVPPSKHFSKVSYEWASGKSPFEVPFAPIPLPLLERVEKEAFKVKSYSYVVGYSVPLTADSESIKRMLSVPLYEGGRAVGLHLLTCRIAARLGVDSAAQGEVVRELMLKYNAEMVHPPLELGGTDKAALQIDRAINFVRESRQSDV